MIATHDRRAEERRSENFLTRHARATINFRLRGDIEKVDGVGERISNDRNSF